MAAQVPVLTYLAISHRQLLLSHAPCGVLLDKTNRSGCCLDSNCLCILCGGLGTDFPLVYNRRGSASIASECLLSQIHTYRK